MKLNVRHNFLAIRFDLPMVAVHSTGTRAWLEILEKVRCSLEISESEEKGESCRGKAQLTLSPHGRSERSCRRK